MPSEKEIQDYVVGYLRLNLIPSKHGRKDTQTINIRVK